ncbi:hypothetical protein GUITHDRAFT_165115 [Guillardia theta CCMP2712]|uniref:PsbP C-terminal domain-containing protein n=1 Tax=Guillardia theta (strain CCMP2712) TaxID=905079 RepID=L1ISE7_GUITC|nr:hypothetical protein GUITHDRAFT_165115 [Guillardia theta CCMP2712]EKX38750.1 hypothetical protein GUITHDRAFT_165115 [Guillardia theta CCMP2712]|eukprot:XP_005825730.1 hypothetical protein GUITHDRAFT_165115 [Guillardia theta CCMP2712]
MQMKAVVALAMPMAASCFLVGPEPFALRSSSRSAEALCKVSSSSQLPRRSSTTLSPYMTAEARMSRKEAVSSLLGSCLLASSLPAFAELPKAECTAASCPEPPENAKYEVETLQVAAGKYSGQGYSFQKPTDVFFKRVQVFDRLQARPGSVLLRDKKKPEIAIFSEVEKIDNSGYTWKPSLVESYTKNFGDKFHLIKQSGPIKTGSVDKYMYEYVVDTEFAGKETKLHVVSSFAASADNVYILNAQAKDDEWGAVGDVLRKCAASLSVNE